MSFCNRKCPCTAIALIVSAILGVIAAFLQIAGVFTATLVFPAVVFGIAVVYLGVLAVTTALTTCESGGCRCAGLNTVLAGILGSILFAVVLLAVGIVATSVASAILVGLTVFFFALTLTATACYVRSLSDCGN